MPGRKTILLLLLGALCVAPAAGQRAAVPTGEIVFASDRAWNQPGEVYLAQPGRAPRDVSRSPYADSGVVVSPMGGTIAFWSARSGHQQVYLARPDGSRLRAVAGAVNPSDQSPGAMSFSPDGRFLLVPRWVH